MSPYSRHIKSTCPLAACTAIMLLGSFRSFAVEKRITVAADGSGDFKTVQEAFAAVPAMSEDRTIIHIKPGTYVGQKILAKDKHKVTLQGENAATTVLTWNINTNEEQPPGASDYYKGTGVVILGNDFSAENLTFENASGDHGQALALRIDGDRAIVTRCRLTGWQDTLMVNNGRQYFRDCYIEGRVDFIYGSGTAWFEHCEIKSKNGGHVTAASTPADHPFGFVFSGCKLTGDPAPWVDAKGAFPARMSSKKPPMADLGRPWRPAANVIYLHCEMGNHIKPEGWNNWGKPENEKTARYAEYDSKGPGANPDKRVPWSKQLGKKEADQITVESVLGGSDHWKPD